MLNDEKLAAIDEAAAKYQPPVRKATADDYNAPQAVVDDDAPQAPPQPLDSVEAFLRRFVAYPSEHARAAHVLWIAHTHMMDAWESTPRIAFLSPEPGSGKSRALEVSEPLVPRPVEAVNVTPAYLFRKVGDKDGRPTILYDEIDTVFGPRTKDNNEEIRGLLNAGHRKHGSAGRCVVRGKEVFTEEIPAYCAVALAGLGDLPDTILTRAVVVRMRRRAPNEIVEPYRRRLHLPQGEAIREKLKLWCASLTDVCDPWPVMPASITDRDADVWEALLAIADAAGGDWPERARKAAVALVAESKGTTPSLGVRMLADLRKVFGTQESMSTDSIIKALCAMDESPWADVRGKPIDARGIAHRLGTYGIKAKSIRIGEHIQRGYTRADLHDSWQRYLVGPSPIGSATSATSATNQDRTEDFDPFVADVAHVADSIGVAPKETF
jgi:hypothetical protein